MDTLKKHAMQWRAFGDSPSGSPGELYEEAPSSEHGGAAWRREKAPAANMFTIAMIWNVLRFLRPSFLSPRGNSKPYKIQPTTYLNGVRGFAACCVYMQHYLVKYFKWLDDGYLSTPEDNVILQLPFIRLIFTGRFMVANFFILSGFVLACKPIRLIRQRDSSLLDCLASSVFRRWPRLFLPLIPPMIVTAFCNVNHWYFAQPKADVIDPNYQYPSLMGRLGEEFGYYKQLINPFTWGTYQPRNTPHMWTLPMEFRGSMVVFLSVLCLSKSKTTVRMSLLTGFAWYCLSTAHWDTFLFVSGMLLAELHLIKRDADYGLEDLLQSFNIHNTQRAKQVTMFSHLFWALVFVFGLFIGSWPCNNASTTPGLITLDSLTPEHYSGEEQKGYFWYSIAAVMIMLALENLPILQRPFNTAFARYLGDISFAFYIIHWTFLWTVGRMITNETISMFGEHLGFFVGAVICIPMTICIADVYWRVFDNGAVNLSRWLWEKCSMQDLPRIDDSRLVN